MQTHKIEYTVSFGDCDPAGIAFYPNIYAWFDRAFHDWLRRYGGHAVLCKKLDAIGIGLIQSEARFRRPIRDGDVVSIGLTIEKWGGKALHLAYEGRVAGAVAVEGAEVRGLFKHGETGMVAAQIEALRKLVENDGPERQR